MGFYIYAIVATDKEKLLEVSGISEEGGPVSIVCYRDVGAVVSSSPVNDYTVSRKNTMIHQKVMETVMEEMALLPVKFSTVGESIEIIREKLLIPRYAELKKLLAYYEGKVELGLKVLWIDPDQVFREIIDENRQIQKLRDRLNSRNGGGQKDQIHLGEMVAGALSKKREQKEKSIGSFFKGLWVEQKKNKPMGDRMITHMVFLVDRKRESDFDGAVNKMSENLGTGVKIKYVGPVPPNHFIELVVRW